MTVGGLARAGICVWKGYTGSLPWLSAMVGLPWTAHGAVCSFYLNMAKHEHTQGGITFEARRATGFLPDSTPPDVHAAEPPAEDVQGVDSPPI